MGKDTRPLSKKKRSVFHLGVWEKAETDGTFECRVVFEGTRRECEEEERRLIKLYGKRVDDSGTLCNFADGGDGGNTWNVPNVEERKQLVSSRSLEMWSRPEYKKKHSEAMNSPEVVEKQRLANEKWRRECPDSVEKHRLSVQKREKFTQEQLNEKYGSDNRGSRWYFNTETRQTKQFRTPPDGPWVPGRKPPKEV
jgi:hypothetical protein